MRKHKLRAWLERDSLLLDSSHGITLSLNLLGRIIVSLRSLYREILSLYWFCEIILTIILSTRKLKDIISTGHEDLVPNRKYIF